MIKTKDINQYLSSKSSLIFMVIVCGIALMIRTVYPFKSVFGYSFTNYLETDAWNRMMYAQQMSDMSFGSSLVYMAQHNLLFSWLISLFGRVLPIELVGAWFPPIIGIGVIIVVFFIGKELFDRNIGLISALFVALIPSEFLHRSLLGFTDHHVLEVLLMALVVLFLIKAIKSPAVFDKYSVWAGVSLILYMLNWQAGFYMMVGFLFALGIAILIYNHFYRLKWYAHSMAILIPVVIALAFYLPIGGWSHLAFLFPSAHDSQAAQTTGEIISTVSQPLAQRTISEIMPLLFPYGSFNLSVVLSNLHFFTFFFLGGLWLLWKQRANKPLLVFSVWTLVMLIITLNERRFLYYLTLNVGILSAFVVFHIAKKLRGQVFQNAIILAIPLALISLPLAKGVSAIQPYQMSEDWHTALVWMRDQPDNIDGKVTAWPDYGHFIKYVSGNEPNYLPGPGGDTLAKFYLSPDMNEAQKYLKELNTSYLIVDEYTLKYRYATLKLYAGSEINAVSSLMYQLYYSQNYPAYLELAYQKESIKIFRYRG